MNIAVIGTGNVGSTLGLAFKKAGHQVIFGVSDQSKFKGKEFAIKNEIAFTEIKKAVASAEVIVLSVSGNLAHEVAKQLGDVKGKILVDTMNAVFAKPAHYVNTAEAVIDNTEDADLVKCFNTTGFENMANPNYKGEGIDMYIAGGSPVAKEVATRLAKDIGFGNVYDFGGNDKFTLIEQFAMCWINLAIVQKQGRDIAFKIVKR